MYVPWCSLVFLVFFSSSVDPTVSTSVYSVSEGSHVAAASNTVVPGSIYPGKTPSNMDKLERVERYVQMTNHQAEPTQLRNNVSATILSELARQLY